MISPETKSEPLTGRGWSARLDGSRMIVALAGDWIARDAAIAETDSARRILDSAGIQSVAFESGQLGHWDSALLTFVLAVRQETQQRGIAFDDAELPPAASRLLALIAQAAPGTTPAPGQDAFVQRVGTAVIAGGEEALAVVELVGDTVLRGGAAFRGRARMRGTDLLTCVYDAGIAALPIVTVVNVLVGGILAFVGAVQLRKFGADIYIAALVGVAVTREMAALMTAIVMSGRTGGAYAAQIATMVGNEEIDALNTIGIPIYDYLILPRVLALTCMMPLLYLYGCAVGIFGGFVVAVAMLNISPDAFIDATRQSVAGSQIVFGLVKSITFGTLIAIAGCRRGLTSGRGAADVGQAATTAVVIGIVGVIALDAIFAVCAHALDF
jgi:phospholipid/cholesterol/gamma-HCH transport system permease protein